MQLSIQLSIQLPKIVLGKSYFTGAAALSQPPSINNSLGDNRCHCLRMANTMTCYFPSFFIGYNLLIKFCFVFSRSGQPRSGLWRGTWVTFLGLDGSDLRPWLWSSWVREQQEGGDWMVMIMMVSSRLSLTCLCLFSSMDVCWYARNNQLSTFIWDISDAYIVFCHLSQPNLTWHI